MHREFNVGKLGGFIDSLTIELFYSLYDAEMRDNMTEEEEQEIQSVIYISILAAYCGGLHTANAWQCVIDNALRADTGKRD